MACPFCATGQMGLTRNLSTGEIVDQVRQAQIACRDGELSGGPTHLSNGVFMGMGAPRANYRTVVNTPHRLIDHSPEGFGLSARNVTGSTVGLVPAIDKLAKEGEETYDLPRVMLEADSYDFSFSGLKTAVLNELNQAKQKGEEIRVADMAASFQAAVIDVLVEKSFRLARELGEKTIVLAGGVSANSGLRAAMESRGEKEGVAIYYPDPILCTDNAAMIASVGYYSHLKGEAGSVYADPNLGLE